MPDAEEGLQRLDELLVGIRVALQRPGYRRQLLAGLDVPGGLANLRLLRAVERLARDQAPSITEVAARLAIEQSTASRAVEVTVQAGLLTKRPCTQDGRRIRLDLTKKGARLLSKATARRVALLSEIAADLGSGDISTLNALLETLHGGFDRLESSA
jgi:DNA-binding MarR family transcriptional regulator